MARLSVGCGWYAATVVLCASVAHGADDARQPSAGPNVLLICVDDLKPLLGCYGCASVKSPNIDSLAARSVLFERAYCNQAVCAPSRNALLTGLRPQTLGIYDLGTNFRQSRPEAVTLPQLFTQHGWRTEGLGKIFHVGHGNHEDPASWSVPHWKSKVVAYAIHVYPRSAPGKGPVLGSAIRTERYRLVEWKQIGAPAEDADLELYDYQTDPLETKNLAADQPEVVARLRVLLAGHPEAVPQIGMSQ